MVHLKDAQARVRIAMGKGVQPGAEHDILADSSRYRAAEHVLCKAAAGKQESTQSCGVGASLMCGHAARSALQFGGMGAENTNRYGIIEDQRRGVVELVRRAPQSHSERRPGRESCLQAAVSSGRRASSRGERGRR